jgi:hypothetical protein
MFSLRYSYFINIKLEGGTRNKNLTSMSINPAYIRTNYTLT